MSKPKVKIDDLLNAGFKKSVRDDGSIAYVLPLNDDITLKTAGVDEDGYVLGIYAYHEEHLSYSDLTTFV